MANVFYNKAAVGANNGSTRADAYTTLAAAITAAGAGGQIWGSHTSLETYASAQTLTFAGVTGNRQKIISIDFSLGSGGTAPVSAELADGCTFQTTGNFALSLVGYFHSKGFKFYSGSGAVSASLNINANAAGHATFEGGEFGPQGTSGGVINFGSTTLNATSNKVKLTGTKVNVKSVTSSLFINSTWFEWENTDNALTGTAIQTNLFTTGHAGVALINGVDLSAQVANGSRYLVNGNQGKLVSFNNCKFDPAILVGNITNSAGAVVTITESTVPDQKFDYRGYWKRNESYSMLDGSNDGTAYSYELTTTAYATYDDPFESLPLAIHNTVTGTPITITVEGIWTDAGAALPQNDDFFIKAAYKGTAGSELVTYASTGQADIFASAANLTASSVTWNASPATPVKFKTSLTFTPQVAGIILVWVCGAAGAARTAYINAQVIKS